MFFDTPAPLMGAFTLQLRKEITKCTESEPADLKAPVTESQEYAQSTLSDGLFRPDRHLCHP